MSFSCFSFPSQQHLHQYQNTQERLFLHTSQWLLVLVCFSTTCCGSLQLVACINEREKKRTWQVSLVKMICVKAIEGVYDFFLCNGACICGINFLKQKRNLNYSYPSNMERIINYDFEGTVGLQIITGQIWNFKRIKHGLGY